MKYFLWGRQRLWILFGRMLVCTFLVVALRSDVRSQSADQPAAADTPTPTFTTPPAPALRPLDELKTIRLAEGYRLELVAADPLIKDPVSIVFDPDGRLWVCEMRGFMPDIEGHGEDAAVGVISVLQDADADGLMDESTIFLDGLVLPRGLCWTIDGMLVCENGTIWLCKDNDGDDRCDEKQIVLKYSPGNLEHALNGLMPALDNWIYNAKEGIRLRRSASGWVGAAFAARGQWGITQDNYGYLHYNVNASLIRGDLVPCYSSIAQSSNSLVDVPLYDEQIIYPIHPTPGINRGYIPGFLRPDGSLIEANSNCGPVVYRGDNLPAALIGDVFIPEPTGNLVRRQTLSRNDTEVTSRNAYGEKEFLASTDERFRPVNMFNAPDGTLYIVDMYRGIIQHGAFITPYLREQILDRKLDKEINLGRIWRVAHETTRPSRRVALSALSAASLVPYLSHSNGWHRDMAQQLLVQRGDLSVLESLEAVATDGASSLGRLHAAWTLEGLGRLDPELLYRLLADPDANVRATAVTLYQRYLAVETMLANLVEDVASVAEDENTLVRMQAVQVLGLINLPAADRALEPILESFARDGKLLEAVLSGFAGRETEFATARLTQLAWKQPEPWRKKLLNELAGVLWRQRDPVNVLRFCHLLNSIPEEQSWQQIALLEGVKDPPAPPPPVRYPPSPGASNHAAASTRPFPTPAVETDSTQSESTSSSAAGKTLQSSLHAAGPRRPMTIRLETAPAGLDRLRQSSNARLAAAANEFAQRLVWPGKDGQPLPEKRKLTEEQRRLVDIGSREYSTLCAGCHHAAGYGLAAKGPQLLGSEWLENEQRLICLVLHGIQGPISVNAELYNADERLSMPGMSKTLDDEQIAGVISYVRREFIDDAPPIDIDTVAALRKLLELRTEPWTQAELLDFVK